MPVAVVPDELSSTGAEVPVVLLAFAFAAVALGAMLLRRRKAIQ
ncbi:LPXTG cell wall anchor domain-containing protein [Microbacterium sp. NIBRBAC000506063]|nr:LPXTG cell wall anchor domain-containing protein [Microbacterium sp. NIBRBAC000506063]